MALAAFTLVKADAQVVVTSSFENWTGGTPDGWVGAKTNFNLTNVTQVSGQSDYGNEAVRLANTSSSHQRFTTQPLAVESGKTYEIKFWVKGQGDIRGAMFDGRVDASGYGYPSSYHSVNTSTWTAFSHTILCENDNASGEFILSVRNTVAPNHIMVDSFAVSEITIVPTNYSIYDIQYTTGGGASPLAGQVVNTGGIVTATYTGGYYLQSNAGAWNGIKVFDNVHTPAIGDSLTLTATVQENFNNTELTSVTAYNVVSSGNPLPGPAIITTTQGNTEMYEGVYARVTSVCVDDNIGFGMWALYTAPDTLKVDDVIYHFTPVVGNTYEVTGVIEYSYNEFKILPRYAADVVLITSVSEENKLDGLQLYPNPANTLVTLTNLPANSNVELIDLTGKLLFTTHLASINTATLNNGIYMVKVTNENSTKTYKLVVKH